MWNFILLISSIPLYPPEDKKNGYEMAVSRNLLMSNPVPRNRNPHARVAVLFY
jgi:hypothetical protein